MFKDLKAFSISWEEWCASDQLEEDASDGPDINAAVVLIGAKDELRCSVVATHHVWRIQMLLRKNLRCTKVTDFDFVSEWV